MSNNSAISGGCRDCYLVNYCGGLENPSLHGCFLDCLVNCNPAQCEYVCPRKLNFVNHCNQVGGFASLDLPVLPVPPIEEFGIYVPKIGTGSRRLNSLQEPIVAISLFKILGFKHGRNYGFCVDTITELRERYHLSAETQIVAVANGFDSYLESFWANYEIPGLLAALGRFGLWGVMVPNYSYFLKVPRTHSLFNRKRAEMTMKAFSENGIPTIPHLQASVDFQGDWQYWKDFLQSHSEVNVVSADFGTGWKDKDMAIRAIKRLAELRRVVARPIILLAIGGAQYFPELRAVWPECTAVDFTPFVKTMMRQKLVAGADWVSSHTPPGEPMDALLVENLRQYRHELALRPCSLDEGTQVSGKKIPTTTAIDDPRQLPLNFDGSSGLPSERVRAA